DLTRAAGHRVASCVDAGAAGRADLAARAEGAGTALDADPELADRPLAGDTRARVDADAELADLVGRADHTVAAAGASAVLADLADRAGDGLAGPIDAEAVHADQRRTTGKLGVAAGADALSLHARLAGRAEVVAVVDHPVAVVVQVVALLCAGHDLLRARRRAAHHALGDAVGADAGQVGLAGDAGDGEDLVVEVAVVPLPGIRVGAGPVFPGEVVLVGAHR